MEDSKLAIRLKLLRESRDLLQKEVADKLGIKANTLSGYENGTRSPDHKLLNDIADFYNVTVDYLLGRSDDPRMSKEKYSVTKQKADEIMRKLESMPEEKRDNYIEIIKRMLSE